MVKDRCGLMGHWRCSQVLRNHSAEIPLNNCTIQVGFGVQSEQSLDFSLKISQRFLILESIELFIGLTWAKPMIFLPRVVSQQRLASGSGLSFLGRSLWVGDRRKVSCRCLKHDAAKWRQYGGKKTQWKWMEMSHLKLWGERHCLKENPCFFCSFTTNMCFWLILWYN